jgi:hypothetical protein
MFAGAVVLQLLAGYGSAIAQSNLVAWGDENQSGELNVPPGTYLEVTAASLFGIGLRSDATLVGWGWNSMGQTITPAGTFQKVRSSWDAGVLGDGF